MLTKDDAISIAKKLDAEISTRRRAHDLALVYYGEKLVATFGIRRGSSRNLPHAHISRDLFVSPHFAMLLASCSKSREDWIKEMQRKGLII